MILHIFKIRGIFAVGFSFIPVLGTVIGAIVGFAVGSLVGVGLQATYETKSSVKKGNPKEKESYSSKGYTPNMPNIHAHLGISSHTPITHTPEDTKPAPTSTTTPTSPILTATPSPSIPGPTRRNSRS
jgi:hypothetical protein